MSGTGDVEYNSGGTEPVMSPLGELPRSEDAPVTAGDPRIDGPLSDQNASTEDNTKRTEDTADTIVKAAKSEEEQEEEEADRLRKLRGEEGDGPRGQGGEGGPDSDGAAGTKPSNDNSALGAQNPGQGGGQPPSMSPPQMSPPQPVSPTMPLGSMTQSDMANAPNRNDRIQELKAKGDDERSSLRSRSGDPDEAAVQEYLQKLEAAGIDYVWGGGHGGDPGSSQGIRDGGVADSFDDYKKSGLDCSGLARLVTYDLYGVDIDGTAANQYSSGKPISASEARAGDIFFPSSAGRPPQHVQVYAGGDQVFEAQKSGTKLKFSPLTDGEFRRYV